MPPESLLDYGFSIMPCRYRTKHPLLPEWKHLQQRRTTVEDVRTWQEQYHPCNWSILLGAVSNTVALDIDSKEAADKVLSLGVPKTAYITSSKYGALLFKHPGVPIHNIKPLKRFGINSADMRGDGGYYMAPGSVHPSGRVYRFGRTIEEYGIADMPDWLLRINTEPQLAEQRSTGKTLDGVNFPFRYVEKTMREELLRIRYAPTGEHNSTTYNAAATIFEYLRELRDYAEREIHAATEEFRNSACDCTDEGLRLTIQSARHHIWGTK